MKKNDVKNSIDELRNRLYRRGYEKENSSVRPEFYSRRPDVPDRWRHGDGEADNQPPSDNKIFQSSMFKKIFIASLIFFVAAVGGAAFLFLGGGNVISSENVGIDILGPVSVAGGDELSLQIVVTNDNNTELRSTDLLVEYPDGVQDPNDISQKLSRYRTSLGVIKPGQTVNKIVRSVLFGEEDSEKTIKVSVEYRVKGSNAIFVKEKDYVITVSSSPVALSVETLNEVNSNQEMEVVVNVASNSDSTIEDVVLRMDYPFNFEPTSAVPDTAYGNNIWELGDIKPGERLTIRIKGIMRGQDNEEKIFSAYVGKRDAGNERKIATVYSSSFKQVLIKKPFIGVELRLNGEVGEEYVAKSGESVTTDITWVNNLPNKITNAVIEVALRGDTLNKFSVSVDRGFYNSTTNTIIWNKASFPDLASIEPGETGRMSFSFSSRSLLSSDMSRVRNPEISIEISAKGDRVSDDGAVEEINKFVTRKVLVNSDLQLTSRGVYYAGPFVNSGPLPPKIGNSTSYTVMWTVVNSSNDVSGASVSATLPSYIKWRGAVSPAAEDISFNENTGEVIWKVGDLPAGTGVYSQPREVAFQISFTPSASQVGRIPKLINNIVLTGMDNFTNTVIKYARPAITTDLTTDPSFNQGQAQVIR